MTKILLVDDHAVVRLGMRALIQQQDGYEVVGEADTEASAVSQALALTPDIILMDIRLGDGSGIAATEQIMQQLPNTKIVMLTSYSEDELLFAAIRAGATGYVLKQVGQTELLGAIDAARKGEGVVDSSLTQKLFSQVRTTMEKQENENPFKELTPQELQVLNLIAKGATNRQIADALFLSHGTIRNYVSNVLGKLYLSNRAEAAAFAIQNNIKEYL